MEDMTQECNHCSDCPFSHTDAAENAINLGCLPDPYEITQMRKNGRTWACHDNQNVPCRGALAYLKEKGIDSTPVYPLITLNDNYSDLIKNKNL